MPDLDDRPITYDFSTLEAHKMHRLLSSVITPRPIAWVSTLSKARLVNVAPYSFFNIVSDDPPLVVLGIGDGERGTAGDVKDTLVNIRELGEFVVNIVDRANAAAMVASAVNYPPEISEAETLGLSMANGKFIDTPYLTSCPAALECRLYDLMLLPTRRAVVFGQVVAMHVSAGIVSNPERLHVDIHALDAIGRLSGDGWYLGEEGLFQQKTLRSTTP